MLIKFVFENFLSFKKSTIIDFEGASIREIPENTVTISNVFPETKILKSLALYGSNASGKSNIIKAFNFTRNFVLTSVSDGKSFQNIPVEPYKLDPTTETKPSLFEVTILVEGIKYRYGFALTQKEVISEWLYSIEKRKEENLFERIGQGFEIDKKFKTEAEGNALMLSKITRENALFITTLGQFKSNTAKKILEWFDKSIVIFDSNNQEILNYTAGLLNQPYYKRRILEIISKADLSFSSIEAEVKDAANRSGYSEGFVAALYDKDIKNYRIYTNHEKHSERKLAGHVRFDLEINESLGSQKFVVLLGPLLKTIKEASIIWIDELDARLHTNLLLFVLRFFNSRLNNPHGSQLVYSSHNSVVLRKDLRRDQMIFVKRDPFNGSIITTLHNWDSKIRSDASFDKDYLEGKYGAVPRIDLSPDLFD